MKTAIILAAGVGSRLRPLTDTIPKCCVAVNGVSLIRRIVSQLNRFSPGMPIYIVTGYLGAAVREELAGCGASVRLIENVDYATSNNMESCRMALEARTETGPSLILNADCIYGDDIVEKMVAATRSCIAADTGIYTDENMKVRLVDGLVRGISKAIPKGENVATSIDIYSFEPDDLHALLAIMRAYHERGDRNQWTEIAIAELVRTVAVDIVDIAGNSWMEIDNHEDLRQAQALFSA